VRSGIYAIRVPTIDAINTHVSGGALYKALKEIRKLMKREDALLGGLIHIGSAARREMRLHPRP
jgi:flagellar biosynthesis regulator FlbT